MSLSVGAPVRVYLHSLVRRLLYSHLTPSTLSSSPSSSSSPLPNSHLSTVLQRTPILTRPLLLPHRSMGDSVWCSWSMHADENSADWADDHTCRGGHCCIVEASRVRCTNTHSVCRVWISAVFLFSFCRVSKMVDLEKNLLHKLETYTYLEGIFLTLKGIWLDLCFSLCGVRSTWLCAFVPL